MAIEGQERSAGAAAAREHAASWVFTGPRSVPVLPVAAVAILVPTMAHLSRLIDYKTGIAAVLGVYATWMAIVLLWRRIGASGAWPAPEGGETSDLDTAVRENKRVRCAGRIRAAGHIEAPRTARACVAYVARWPFSTRVSEVVSEAAPMEIELATGDRVELESGRWRVRDPFGSRARGAEATLDDATEVVVCARVEEIGAATDDARRGGARRYRLLSDGGEIVPVGGHASAAVLETQPSLTSDVLVASLMAALVAGVMAVARGHIGKNRWAPPASGECGVDGDCRRGERCRSRQCVPAPPPTSAPSAGSDCSGTSDCPTGLRCRHVDPAMIFRDHRDPEAPPGSERARPRCTQGCRNDADCPSGKLCAPCRRGGGPYADSYDGNCFAREELWGDIAAQCDANHATPASSAANSAAPAAR